MGGNFGSQNDIENQKMKKSAKRGVLALFEIFKISGYFWPIWEGKGRVLGEVGSNLKISSTPTCIFARIILRHLRAPCDVAVARVVVCRTNEIEPIC